MLRQILLVVLLLGLRSAIPSQMLAQTSQPWTCGGVRTPDYDVSREAEAGDPVAMALLSQLYFCGTKSGRLSKSFYWASLAAEKGNTLAMVALAHFYQGGIGVKKNTQTAGEWYFRAANAGEGKMAIEPLLSLYHNGLYFPPEDIAECLQAYNTGIQAISAGNFNLSHAEMKRSYLLGCKWAANYMAAQPETSPRRYAAPSAPGRDAITPSAPYSPKEKSGNSVTFTGCLVQAQGHQYLVFDDRHPRGVSVRFSAGDMDARASALIGHKVIVTGVWSPDGLMFVDADHIDDISPDCSVHDSPNNKPG
jgi:hypothetical protein